MASGAESLQRHRAAVRARLLRSDYVRAGPDSITWKINREVIVVAGWGRAILLQLAHPAVAAGVHDHSSFRGSLLSSFRRLHSTVGAMLSLTFGDTEQMITAAAGINAIHDRVRGRVREGAGEAYSAHDPDLQRWVHATLLESIPLTYELLVGPLTLRERDRYCAEAAIMEPLLGMPAGWLPRDSAQLDTYMREMLAGGRIVVTDTSRALAERCCTRRDGTWPGRRFGRCSCSRSDRFRHRSARLTDSSGTRATSGRSRAGRRCSERRAAASAARARVADGEASRSICRLIGALRLRGSATRSPDPDSLML